VQSITSPHYTVQTVDLSTRFTIRAGKLNCSSLFLGLWLCGWAIGEVFAIGTLADGVIQSLTSGESSLDGSWLGLVIWLLFWTFGGGIALVIFLWQVAGREVIEISYDAFKIGRKVLGIGPNKSYNPINVDNLRIDENQPAGSSRASRFGTAGSLGGGRLVFDYGGAQVRFGSGLDSNEAKLLLAEIQSRYPRYRSL
jgi:hypothetical protein